MKKSKIINIVFIVCILMVSYLYISTRLPYEPPEITIIIEDKQIDYVVGKNQWNGAKYDREDTFTTLMKVYSVNELPYIEIGSTAIIKFTKYPPDKVTITDIIIDDSGMLIYSDKANINIPVEIINKVITFEIKKYSASALSSYYVEENIVLRGFRINATWGQNECEYAFIIKTDGL